MRMRAVAVVLLIIPFANCSREPKPPVPTPPQEQIQQKFTGLYRAARAIDAATAEGVNYATLTELLSAMSKEMLIARDMAVTEQEKAVVAAYEELLSVWKDSVAFWDRKLLAAKTPIFGPLPYWGEGSDLTAKATRYDVEVRKTSKGGLEWVVVTDPEPVQRVWKVAEAKSKKAVQLYLGPRPPSASTAR